MCFIARLKLALTHGFYVGGLTFFSTLSTKFIDEQLVFAELHYCIIAGFIAGGMAFFSSVGLQQYEKNYKTKIKMEAYKEIKSKGYDNKFISSLKNILNPSKHLLFCHNMFLAVHSTQSIKLDSEIYD